MMPTRRIFREKRRYIYPLVAALVINAALFVAVVYPLSVTVQGGEQQAAAAADALTAARREHVAARATVSGKASADDELKKFYGAVLPPDEGEARRLLRRRMYELAGGTNLTVLQTHMSDPAQERGSHLGRVAMDGALIGDYRDIRRFIHELETRPEFVILENVALQQGTETGRGLNVSVQIATYFRAGGNGN